MTGTQHNEEYGAGRIVRERPGDRVELRPRPDQSDEQIEADFEASWRFSDNLRVNGTEHYHSHYRWIGPVKVMAYKEVGPPPWKWPRVGVQTRGWKNATVRFIAGWRSTAYAVVLMWAPKPSHSQHPDAP